MTSSEIWTKTFDLGLKDKRKMSGFSPDHKRLFYFIDFVLYCEMGGATGFLYNSSPADADDHSYSPYIDALRFFGFEELAGLVEKFQEESIKKLQEENDEDDSWEDFTEGEMEELEEQIADAESEMDIEHVYQWIDAHHDKLVAVLS